MTQALEQIWNELAGKLREFIRRRVSDEAEAEDILQDVFLKLARRAEQPPEPAKLQGWIFLITRHAIIDHYRARKPAVEVPETLMAETEAVPEEREWVKASILRMIRSLPEPYREAIVLAELEGVPQVEIARRLGISVSAAKSRVQRGRRALKEMLLECCQFEFDRRGRLHDCQPRTLDCPECGVPASAGTVFEPGRPGLP